MSLRLIIIGKSNEANYNPHKKGFIKESKNRKERRQSKQFCQNNQKVA